MKSVQLQLSTCQGLRQDPSANSAKEFSKHTTMKPFAISFFILLAVGLSCGLIHDLRIQNDNRRRFFIENFGFEAHGEIHMDIYKFKV